MSGALRVVVAGGGVTGSLIALKLASAGLSVVLVDPAPVGDNASGVAAGMLAPAFETVLDDAGADHFNLLRAGRDLWPSILARLGGAGVGFRSAGALWVDRRGDAAKRSEMLVRSLAAIGAVAALLHPSQALDLAPGLVADIDAAVFTSDDWLIDAVLALSAIRIAVLRAGCECVTARVLSYDECMVRLSGGAEVIADRLILATGAGEQSLAPELASLSPIKGQILRFAGRGPAVGPAIRCSGGYAAPASEGVLVGATMEAGKTDLMVDEAKVETLSALAASLYPALAGQRPRAAAGVRAATPDGLPLVGASAREGVLLAVGMRRNGWLLAPLAAEIIAADLVGDDPGPHALRLEARRFDQIAPPAHG